MLNDTKIRCTSKFKNNAKIMQNWHLGKFRKMDEHTTVVHVVTFNTNLMELRSHAQGLH